MEAKNLTIEANEQLFYANGTQMPLREFVNQSVSKEQSSLLERTTLNRRDSAGLIVPVARQVKFNGISLASEQFRVLRDIPLEELSFVGFQNLLGALSIYAPKLFKDKAVFAQTKAFKASEMGKKALLYKKKSRKCI